MYRRKFLAASLSALVTGCLTNRFAAAAVVQTVLSPRQSALSILEHCSQMCLVCAREQGGPDVFGPTRVHLSLAEVNGLCEVAITSLHGRQPVASAFWQSLADACGRCKSQLPWSHSQAFDNVIGLAESRIQ